MFCGHCDFLRRVTQRPLDTRHDPDQCPNRQHAVRLLEQISEADDNTQDIYEDQEDQYGDGTDFCKYQTPVDFCMAFETFR